MSSRSAPFDTSLIDPNSEASPRTQKSALLSSLFSDVQNFRDSQFPPPFLKQIRDLPIYSGNPSVVKAYYDEWRPLIDRAMGFYPTANTAPDFLPLPASLEIPQFIYRTDRINLTKTKAKESKSFGSVGALIDKCGEYSDKDMQALEGVVSANPDGGFKLVAHREFIDLRAYAFCRDHNGIELPPQRIRFYRTGLIVEENVGFKVVDGRQEVRKRRSDAYTNPIADNGVWRVFVRPSI